MNTLVAKLRSLFRRRNLEAEMAEEMRQHLERRIQEKITDGLAPDEARYAAQREFGGLAQVQEQCRDERSFVWLEQFRQDVRHGLRQVRRNPGFTAVAVLMLALGIGANTAIFSVLNAVLLRPLPFHDPERLLYLEATSPNTFTAGDFSQLAAKNRALSDVAAYAYGSGNFSGGLESPERIDYASVSENLLTTLGVVPVLGRNFLPQEDQAGGDKVVLINHRIWQRCLGGDESIIGRTVSLDGYSHTVIGVLPAGFNFPPNRELLLPLALSAAQRSDTNSYYLWLVARMKPGMAPAQVNPELSAILKRIDDEADVPAFRKKWAVRAVGLREAMVGDVRHIMIVLMAAVGFIALIACANVANLLLTAAAHRQREIATRLALGATRSRIIRQLLVESLVLAALGGIGGVMLAYWAAGLISAFLPAETYHVGKMTVDTGALVFTSALTLCAWLLFSVLPAFRAAQIDLNAAFKSSGRTVISIGGARLRNGLVVSQVAITLVLLIGAGLLLQSLLRLQNVPLGFQPEHLLTARVRLSGPAYSTPGQRRQFAERLSTEIRARSEMSEAAFTSQLPFATGRQANGVLIEGRHDEDQATMPFAQFRSVSPDFFKVMRIALIRGREFSDLDHAGGPPVVVINDVMAKKYWPNDDPIGKRIQETSNEAVWREVVGIVGGVRHQTQAQSPEPEMFVPWNQHPALALNVVVRTAISPVNVAAALRRTVGAIDPELPVFEVMTMEARLSEAVAQPRFRSVLVASFAAIALLMAAVGLYGVIAFAVTQRTREIGIRMSLGAQRSDVTRLVLGQGMKLAMAGAAIGLVGAAAITRLLSSLLFEITPHDPGTIAGVTLLLVAVCAAACWVPARRAAQIDPMSAIRYE